MSSSTEDEDTIVKEALRLIENGWAQLYSKSSNHTKRDVIFVLGGTGSGKSTVVQIVTGDLQRLHSTHGQRGTGLVIVDEAEPGSGSMERRIGDPQVASKTFLPEYLSCDDDNSLVFVDCPGFNDNRGPQMDIASMVLIKKISEQVDLARFLFVIPSSSVSYLNISRNDFLLLCTHATSFMKNVDKVKDSVSLIVTKVNNCDPSTGERIEDQAVINETIEFLTEVSRQPTTSENREFIGNLLRDPSKWTLIRYPNKKGPLSNIDHFVKVRQEIREICKNKLTSVPVTSQDFAITLSSDSKYIIAKRLIPHMKGEIDRLITGLVNDLEIAFITRFQEDLQTQRTIKLVATVKNLEEICKKLKKVERSQCRNDTLPVNDKVSMLTQWLQISLNKVALAELKKVEEQLYLFQHVTEQADLECGSSVKISNAFSSLTTKLEELLKSTLTIVKDVTVRNVEGQITELVQKIITQFQNDYTAAFWNSLANGDGHGLQALKKLSIDSLKFESLESSGISSDGEKLSDTLKRIWGELRIELAKVLLRKLVELENELDMLLELTDQLGRYQTTSISGSITILPEIRTVLCNLRTDARETVRDKYIQLVHRKIQQILNGKCEHLEEAIFQREFYPGLNLKTMAEKRQTLMKIQNRLKKSFANSKGSLFGVDEMFRLFTEIPEIDEMHLGKYENILNFYDEFLGNPFPRPVEKWIAGLRLLQEKVNETDKLYEFLELARNTNPNTIEEDLVVAGDDEGEAIMRFLEALRATSDIRQFVQQRASMQDKMLIHNLARFLENGKTTYNSGDDGMMVVKGRHVKFSDFLNESGVLRGESYGISVNKVLVLASDTVKLDRDFQGQGKTMTVTVIADKWLVQGATRSIQLSGSDGLPHREKKAEGGKRFGCSGSNGLPGNCGGNGGNFFGVYNEIENASALRIYANGGNGGPGQDGGDGYPGKPGKDAVPEDRDNGPVGKVGTFLARVGVTFVSDSTINGAAGGRGGNGGDGGVGGKPGFEGCIKLFPVTCEVSLGKMSSGRGSIGPPGEGGKGAKGGNYGKDFDFASLARYVGKLGDTLQRGPDGRRGKIGGNSYKQSNPPPQSVVDLDRRDVEEFRKYIMDECQGSTGGSRFLKQIDTLQDLSRHSKR